MDHQPHTNWRQMFDRGRPPTHGSNSTPSGDGTPAFGYDDGYDPAQCQAASDHARATLSPEEITDEAAMALALDTQEYRPWVLQRGTRPLMMLHLRRYDAKAGHWIGWQVPYPQLVAVEYVGDKLLTLDFGSRQFAIEGAGLDKLARHLQNGSVLLIQERSAHCSFESSGDGSVDMIRMAL